MDNTLDLIPLWEATSPASTSTASYRHISIGFLNAILPSSLTRPLDGPVDCRGGDRVVPVQAKSHVSIDIRTHVA